MTASIRSAGAYGSSVAPQSIHELYPRGGEVDDTLYILHADDGSSETAAIVRTENTVTVVTPTRILPRVNEDALQVQKLGVKRKKYGEDAVTILRRAHRTGMSTLQSAVCDLDNNITDYLT